MICSICMWSTYTNLVISPAATTTQSAAFVALQGQVVDTAIPLLTLFLLDQPATAEDHLKGCSPLLQ